MILGLAFFTPLALSGTVFYLFHHIIVKTNLFLISGITHHLQGSFQLKDLGGIYRRYPLLALLFLIPALSLAGVPPLSGFFAKFVVIKAGLLGQEYLLVCTALLVGVLTLYSMTKIWAEAFWAKNRVPDFSASGIPVPMILPVLLMAIATVLIGLFAEPLFRISQLAASQLMDPAQYIHAVLGGNQ